MKNRSSSNAIIRKRRRFEVKLIYAFLSTHKEDKNMVASRENLKKNILYSDKYPQGQTRPSRCARKLLGKVKFLQLQLFFGCGHQGLTSKLFREGDRLKRIFLQIKHSSNVRVNLFTMTKKDTYFSLGGGK